MKRVSATCVAAIWLCFSAGHASNQDTTPASELEDLVERYSADQRVLLRRYDTPYSPERRTRLTRFYDAWIDELESLDFDALGVEGRVDWVLLRKRLVLNRSELAREGETLGEVTELLPFAEEIWTLHDRRRDRLTAEGAASARALERIADEIETLQKRLAAGRKSSDAETATSKTEPESDEPEAVDEVPSEETEPLTPTKIQAHRAARVTDALSQVLSRWNAYYSGYDPTFTWWTKAPFEKSKGALDGYTKFLRETLLDHKKGKDAPIVGDPVGRQALLDQLASEIVPYTPEELVGFAEAEMEWCREQMERAAEELGFDDWKDALEKVKTLHVEPGKQPDLVRDLALEATEWIEERDLVTVPELAKEVWRMEMMSPERQKMNPFFLGGEAIIVSFPTDTMSHEEKLMSLRGNNEHFARATVHHELIPGHHLQGFMTSRYNSHRRAFRTPFWGEGWALYWELKMWDLNFARSPEDRIGMLFWRMHRCARVIWSLGFHLGEMTPEEAVEYLVDNVGHERENALGEVRRSFEGTYPPLYQLAYLMGGFQFRALHRELVENGEWENKAFHDAILRGGRMPVEMVRARLRGDLIEKDHTAAWRFQDLP
ncbi:MAG: DUF885 family protein [Acidobacteriota bacterium]